MLYCVSATLDDNKSIYVTDETPFAETQYNMRYYFDVNSLVMAKNNSHIIFNGFTGSTNKLIVRLVLRKTATAYQLKTRILNDSNSWTDSVWVTISDAPLLIEMSWRAATSAGANNGGLTMWIDSAVQVNLTGIDNDTRRMEKITLGATAGVDTGTRGTYYFDGFESWR